MRFEGSPYCGIRPDGKHDPSGDSSTLADLNTAVAGDSLARLRRILLESQYLYANIGA